MDIHKSFDDIHKSFLISIYQLNIGYKSFMDILNSFKDIQKVILGHPKMNYGYPKISLCLRISIIHFWISIKRFMAIQYSTD